MSANRPPPATYPRIPGVPRDCIRAYDVFTHRSCELRKYVGRVLIDRSAVQPPLEGLQDAVYDAAVRDLGLVLQPGQTFVSQAVDMLWTDPDAVVQPVPAQPATVKEAA